MEIMLKNEQKLKTYTNDADLYNYLLETAQ